MSSHSTVQDEAPTGSIAQRVTAQIIDALRNGVRPWVQPWSNDSALVLPLRHNGIPYQGINTIALWATALERGYTARHWFTFKQARELGARVRRGERGTLVVYYSGARTADAEEGETPATEPRRAFLKSFVAFNAQQIDNLPAQYLQARSPPTSPSEAALAARFASIPATIHHGGNRACYRPTQDVICLPSRDAFTDWRQYYATLLHELAHWTRHPTRLDRDFDARRFGDAAYAREELVAELTAAFLGAACPSNTSNAMRRTSTTGSQFSTTTPVHYSPPPAMRNARPTSSESSLCKLRAVLERRETSVSLFWWPRWRAGALAERNQPTLS